MTRQFWVKTTDDVDGPFSSHQIREAVALGKLQPEHLLSSDQQHWVHAADVKGLHFPQPHEAGRPASMMDEQVVAWIDESNLPSSEQLAPIETPSDRQPQVPVAASAEVIDNGDGTVTDQVTGLMWQKEDDGQKRTLRESQAYCSALRLGGHCDWRLPTIDELRALSPAVKHTITKPKRDDPYWSSTVVLSPNPDVDERKRYAAKVVFSSGEVNHLFVSYRYYTRAVRSSSAIVRETSIGGKVASEEGDDATVAAQWLRDHGLWEPAGPKVLVHEPGNRDTVHATDPYTELRELIREHIRLSLSCSRCDDLISRYEHFGENAIPLIEQAIADNWHSRSEACSGLLYAIAWIGGEVALKSLERLRECKLADGRRLPAVTTEHSHFATTARELYNSCSWRETTDSIDEKRLDQLVCALDTSSIDDILSRFSPTPQELVALVTRLARRGERGTTFEKLISLVKNAHGKDATRAIPLLIRAGIDVKAEDHLRAGVMIADALSAHGSPSEVVGEMLQLARSETETHWASRLVVLVCLAELGETRVLPLIETWIRQPGLLDWVTEALKYAASRLGHKRKWYQLWK